MSGFDFELSRAVKALAAPVKDSNPHWICTPHGEYETNSGNDWCVTCGHFMFRHLRGKDRRHAHDYFFDGGSRIESDHHLFCAHCGCWLRVSLTDYAVEEELTHYREHGVGHDANAAYAIDLLMSAASWGGPHVVEITDLARQLIANAEAREAVS